MTTKNNTQICNKGVKCFNETVFKRFQYFFFNFTKYTTSFVYIKFYSMHQ